MKVIDLLNKIANGEKRYKESEIIPYCKEALKVFQNIVLKENKWNKKV